MSIIMMPISEQAIEVAHEMAEKLAGSATRYYSGSHMTVRSPRVWADVGSESATIYCRVPIDRALDVALAIDRMIAE